MKCREVEELPESIMKAYSFALVKVVDPDLNEFNNSELVCGNSKIKVLKPDWIA